MDNNLLIGLFFLLLLISIFIMNYKIILNNIESFDNNFTDDKCCCSKNAIDKCNKYGKSCVCDYYDKNKHLCQSSY